MSTQADREKDPVTAPPPTPVSADGRPLIHSLTGVRAVVAAFVVIVHFRDPIFGLLPGLAVFKPPVLMGYVSVEIFFVISGFVLAYNYAERMRSRDTLPTYWWARFARLYPVNLATIVIVILLGFPAEPGLPADRSLRNLVGNLLVLQAVPPFKAIDPPSWSLSVEAGAYFLFLPLAWWAVRLSARSAMAWAAAVVVGGIVAINLIVLGLGVPERWSLFYPVMWLRGCVTFAAGVLLWAWWRRRPAGSWRWDVVAVGCLLATMGFSYCLDVSTVQPISLVVVPLLVLFVPACALATGPVCRLLSSRVMQWAGNLTYSVYMTHFILYLLFIKFVPWEDYADAWLPVRLAFLAVLALWIVGAGAALYYFVEVPGRKALLNWWRRRQAARDSG